MTDKPDIDLQSVHKKFSVQCFNQAWEYIDKPTRTTDEEDKMLRLSLASLWHWTQRQDCTPINLSIGYWQVSRVFALLHQADNARHYGELALQAIQTEDVDPFYTAYAHEALARAELVAGNQAGMEEHWAQAHKLATLITRAGDKKLLLADLATIHS